MDTTKKGCKENQTNSSILAKMSSLIAQCFAGEQLDVCNFTF